MQTIRLVIMSNQKNTFELKSHTGEYPMLNKKVLRYFLFCVLAFLTHCSDSPNSGNSHVEFNFYTVGSGGVYARFGVNIYEAFNDLRANTGQFDTFLLAIAEEPLTFNQIQRRSGLTESRVEYFISYLDSCNMIRKVEQNRWATTLPVVTDKQMKIIRKDLAPMASHVAQYLEKEIPRIRTLYDSVKSPLDPPWEDISHLIVSKFIIDGTFHSHLNRLKRERDNQVINKLPVYMRQQGRYNSNFGCNWYKFNEADLQREVYVLHGAIFDRYGIAMNKYRRDRHFITGLFNISAEDGIEYLTVQEKAILRDLDWISDDRLLVPIVEAGTIKQLWPAMEKIGQDGAGVAFARYGDIADAYRRSTYSEFLDHDEDYIQVLIHSLFGLTIEHLVESGTVSSIPKPVPESFGVYFVFGKLF